MNPAPTTHELVELFGGRLRLYQPHKGYRFSIDAVLLGSFAASRAGSVVADLGTGNGILPVLLARRQGIDKITGIEIQQELAEIAGLNTSLNKCSAATQILHADMRGIKTMLQPESFDSVITNPPFYRVGSGRINPDSQKAAARHELHGTLRDFISSAFFLLKQNGSFIAVYPAARTVDLIAEMRLKNLEPKTLRFVHSRCGEPAELILVEGVKTAGTEAKILPPLFLYDDNDEYTPEMNTIFNEI
ncbi:MAG: tRNA1(Val) (adenine(37)-N6)-methyltransferase [Deltaproteobacteria bacterium]|nr:tRNA1(Val) (adenine(37)-N6)-methyltransferase [Deltaproteobacteria bacterium]